MNNHKKSLAYSGDKIQDYHKIQVCIFRFLPFCDIYKYFHSESDRLNMKTFYISNPLLLMS